MIICPECSTENEESYEFCKNCGTPLKKSAPKTEAKHQPRPQHQPFVQSQPQSNGFVLETIDGNPIADVKAFIGKNADEFLTKFSKMEITGSRVSWCWPAALLGLFLGPMGAAIWFLYRKMYKIATVLFAVGFALGAMNWAFFGTLIPHLEIVENISDALSKGLLDASFFVDYATSDVFDTVDTIICFVGGVLGGLLGTRFYKDFVKNKINKYRGKFGDMNYYSFGLSAIGGVSGGALAIGIALYIVLDDLLTYIPSILERIFGV